jgi:hypothetical protein
MPVRGDGFRFALPILQIRSRATRNQDAEVSKNNPRQYGGN